jgi:outer membrane protein TolC
MEISIAEEYLRRAVILHSFGLTSNNSLRAAEQNVALNRLQLEEALRNHYNLLQSLNLLLGQPASQNTVIQLEREIQTLPEDLNRHISEAVAQSVQVRQMQIEIERASDELQFFENQLRESRLHTFEPETNEERNARISLQEAHARTISRRNQEILAMEADMRRAFNDLENLLSRKELQLLELENAQSNLEITIENLELGLSMPLDVTQAELAVLRAKQNIERTLSGLKSVPIP